MSPRDIAVTSGEKDRNQTRHAPPRTCAPSANRHQPEDRRHGFHVGRRRGAVMREQTRRPCFCLTQGDPAGIGPEITLRAWWSASRWACRPSRSSPIPPTSPRIAQSLRLERPDRGGRHRRTAPAIFERALPVIPLTHSVDSRAGPPDPRYAAAVIESIETAVRLVSAARRRALVTNPIAKHVLYEAGFRHPGHTEFLAALGAPCDGRARCIR